MLEDTYKNELEQLIAINEQKGAIPYAQVIEFFKEDNFDLLDEVIEYLENKNCIILHEEDEEPTSVELEIKDLSAELEELDENEVDDLFVEESEIKVSDFDTMDQSVYQSDDIVKMYLHEIGQIELLTITQELELARQVQDGLMSKEKINQYAKLNKKLSKEEFNELNEKIESGKAAQDILIESNLRLVVSVAKKYNGRGLSLSDLIQEGNVGLMKAVVKYDPTRGFKFSTYATWWIRQAITRSIADKGRNVRIPVHMHESINRLIRTQRRLVQELHREPTLTELAEELKLPLGKVVELKRVSQDSISFDNTVGDEEDSTLIDLVADENTLNTLEFTEKSLFCQEIDEVIQSLTPREEMVIRLRYGIGANIDRSHTLEEVGKIMGVTRERVRQIEFKALQRLRTPQRLKKIKQHIAE